MIYALHFFILVLNCQEDIVIHMYMQGILEWVTDNMKKGSKELQEKVQMLQKERDQIMAAYKEKRALVDQLKAELQTKIAQYSKFAEKGE